MARVDRCGPTQFGRRFRVGGFGGRSSCVLQRPTGCSLESLQYIRQAGYSGAGVFCGAGGRLGIEPEGRGLGAGSGHGGGFLGLGSAVLPSIRGLFTRITWAVGICRQRVSTFSILPMLCNRRIIRDRQDLTSTYL